MGDTYSFSKVGRKRLLAGDFFPKSKEEEDSWWCLDVNPVFNMLQRNDIGNEMDRAYYLSTILGGKGLSAEDIDPVFKDQKFRDWLDDNHCFPVNMEMARNGLKLLRDLDAKVYSMPFTPPKDGETVHCGITEDCCKESNLKGGEYVEEDDIGYGLRFRPGDKNWFYGPDKDYVAILKEVAKIYRWKYYHYAFPWKKSRWKSGSSDIQSNLEALIKEMDADSNNEWVFVTHWW